MAEPGDPVFEGPSRAEPIAPSGHRSLHDHDDLIGFSSAASLQGQTRAPSGVFDPVAVQASRPLPTQTFGRATPPPVIEGALSLYTVYALILFAVPTLGASAAIALLAVWRRRTPDQPLARSHLLFQQRTLVIAAIAAVVGVILIAVNVGVLVLFALAVWLIVRGAWGLLTLAAGRTLIRPRQGFIGGSRP